MRAKRSQAQEKAVQKAARVSGERRKAAKRRRENTELREAQERVGPAVEVVPMRVGPPCRPGMYYIVNEARNVVNEARNAIVAGPFRNASVAVRYRIPGTHVAREG